MRFVSALLHCTTYRSLRLSGPQPSSDRPGAWTYPNPAPTQICVSYIARVVLLLNVEHRNYRLIWQLGAKADFTSINV